MRSIPLWCVAGLLLAGCSEQPTPVEVELAPVGPIPATEQRAGDPEAGYRTVVGKGYVTCGLPYEAYRASTGDEPPEHPLPGREGRAAELPYNLNLTTNADGVELVVSNCLTCHGAEFNGKLVIGLGNEFLDFTNDPLVGVESVGAFVADGAPARAWEKWADRIGAIAPYMVTDTVGVNPAPNLTLALIAHRDPKTLEWHDEPLLEPPPERPLPVSVPPWWRMQKKHAMFYNGMGRGDQASYMMMKSLVCTDNLDEAREIDSWFTDVRAFIASLRAPDYPFAVDTALADEGRPVFERHCSGCHGTYGEDWTYPNLILPLDVIGTDPAYAEQVAGGERFFRWFNRSFYGEKARARPALGYVAPPLDGVWATAPYLHNGSVPSIRVLLDSPTRPRYWRHRLDPRDYDTAALGWRHDALDHGKAGAADETERRHIYDTTQPGYGNGGHTFGDALSEAERSAVLEYLKTL